MKKRRRLSLGRETIRVLEDAATRQIAGGWCSGHSEEYGGPQCNTQQVCSAATCGNSCITCLTCACTL
jgi:hypothetical protein